MRILSITAGAANMYCGSCLRDNALAAELIRRGHEVTLMPVYTPTLTDEANVSTGRVLFGGISVYLEQYVPLFRRSPAFLDRLWDAAPVIRAFSRRSMSTDPRMLGELTVSMLKGEHGHQRKEFEKLVAWLRTEPKPDVVNLPNSLLIAMAAPIRRALGAPVTVTLQGEDLFLDGLHEPWRSQALELIRGQVGGVDLFVAVSEFCARRMRDLLAIPESKLAVVPLGIALGGYEGPRKPRTPPFTVGFFARLAPEKGLHELAEAYRLLRQTHGLPAGRLEAAGYLAAEHRPYLAKIEQQMRGWGLGDEFAYRGTLSREEKVRFLRGLDVLSVPGPYPDVKGIYLLEAMAAGTPVVQPRRGAYEETLERTGGGMLTEPTVEAIAEGLLALSRDAGLAERLGRVGAEGVRAHYSVAREADRAVAVYEQLLGSRVARAVKGA
ncbi:MAG TPA: glycosyltransferase family 4 protein [Methylomirabilota bacterium]